MKKWNKILGLALLPLTIGSVSIMTSCDNKPQEVKPEHKHVDYVEKAKLWTDYKGHDFEKDGIGQIAFANHVDGDTTHGYALTKDGKPDRSRLLKIRYLGVDTPESTGKIQKWGLDASDFTKLHTNPKLSKYKTIVLSSDFEEFKPCKMDSNDRVLAYVWVGEGENCPFEELKLLNLWLIEEGYSSYKGAVDASLYKELFFEAEEQAKKEDLFIWGSADDPRFNYSAGYQTTLKNVVEGLRYIEAEDKYIKWDWIDPNNNPEEYRDQGGDYSRVRFDCTVAMTQADNAYVYDDDVDADGNAHRYGMFIFAGYKGYGQVFKPMNRISVCGSVAEHFGNLQISDVSYNPPEFADDKDMQILEKNPKVGEPGHKEYEPVVFENIDEAKQENNVNVVCKINDLVPTGYYHKDLSKDAYTVGMKNETGDIDLRFERNLLKYNNQTIGHQKNDYNYEEFFSVEGGKSFDLVGPLTKHVFDNSSDVRWQVQAIKTDALTVNEIAKTQKINNLFNGGNI